MPITIDFLSNTSKLERGTANVEKAFEGVADSLDDVARDSQQSGRTLERALDDAGKAGTDAGREIERAGDRVERTFEQMAREARDADRQIEKVGDGGKRGFGQASEAAGEFKDEALSNFSEVTSSFDGSMTSIQDLVQGTLGGLAGSIPGIGVIAGAAAAGVGLIGSAFVAADEERQRFQDRANDLASAYIDAGQAVLDTVTISSRVSGVLTSEDTRKEAENLAKTLGVDLADAARIVAGDTNALATAYELLEARQDSLQRQAEATTQVGEEQMIQLGQTEGAINSARGALDKYSDSNRSAEETARANSQALHDLIGEADSATRHVDELGNEIVELPDGQQIFIDAETKRASLNVDRFKGDLKSVPKKVTARVDVDTSAIRALQGTEIRLRGRVQVDQRIAQLL